MIPPDYVCGRCGAEGVKTEATMRSALAEVLAALSDGTPDAFCGLIDQYGVPYIDADGCLPRAVWAHDGGMAVYPLHDAPPAEAIEALVTRDLWPWAPGDGPRWWCERCHGGSAGDAAIDCDVCGCLSHTADPPSLASLVAVASLGAPTLLRVAGLAAEIARHSGCAGARLVWRVMGREAIEELARRWDASGGAIGTTWSMEGIYAIESARVFRGSVAWPKGFDEAYQTTPEKYAKRVAVIRAAWRAMRSLAVGDGETPRPTGLHLLALDAQRIVIGVESVGGDR